MSEPQETSREKGTEMDRLIDAQSESDESAEAEDVSRL